MKANPSEPTGQSKQIAKSKRKTIYQKLEENTFYSPDGCWIWTGAVNYQGGYGRLVHNFIRGVHPNIVHALQRTDTAR